MADTESETDPSCEIKDLILARLVLGTGDPKESDTSLPGSLPSGGRDRCVTGILAGCASIDIASALISAAMYLFVIATWVGGVGFNGGRRGKTLTGLLARARGPSQKFPALLSTYYVLGRA